MAVAALSDDDLPSTLVFEHLEGLRPDETITPGTHAVLREAGARAWVEALPQLVDDGPVSGAEFTRIEAIGVGGTGVVERAHQRSVGREVAIKRLRDPSLPGAAEMLLEEGRVMGLLEHPSIVPVLAVGRDATGQPVLVMKRVEGTTWRRLLRDPSHPDWRLHPGDRLEFHLRVLAQVADVAHFAHGRSWLHRDIKPDNVMVGPGGEVYLIDWGLAVHLPAATAPGARDLVGTPGYMAPEMIEGSGPWLTPRTDVYLLGATLHEVLTGRTRHVGDTLRAVLTAAWLSEPFEYPEATPAELASLATAATCANPDERPASAEAFRQRIDGYLSHRAALAALADGRARFEHLRALTRQPGGADEVEVQQRVEACVAVLRRALERWPGSAESLEALTEVLAWRIRRALAVGDVLSAQAALSELPSADGPLEAEVSLALERIGRERLRDARLSDLGRRHDARPWAPVRARAARVSALVGGGAMLALGACAHAGLLALSWPVLAIAAAAALGVGVAASAFALGRDGGVDRTGRRQMFWVTAGAIALAFAGRHVGLSPGQALALLPVFAGAYAGLLGEALGLARWRLVAMCAVSAALAPTALRWGAPYLLDLTALTAVAAHLVIARAWEQLARDAGG